MSVPDGSCLGSCHRLAILGGEPKRISACRRQVDPRSCDVCRDRRTDGSRVGSGGAGGGPTRSVVLSEEINPTKRGEVTKDPARVYGIVELGF